MVNVQYSRRKYLEVVDIPKEVEQKDLKGKVLLALEKVSYKIDPDNIEDCHRLSKESANVIIKFSRIVTTPFRLKRICETLIWRISIFMGKIKFT